MAEDSLEARLRAVERAVTDGDAAVADLSDAASVHDRLDDLEADVAALADRVDALDATVQSLHGYVGEIEHVNERVERRADAARAAVERLEDSTHWNSTGRGRESPQRADVEGADGERASAGSTADAAPSRAAELDDSGHGSDSSDYSDPSDSGDGSLVDRVRDAL